MNDKQIKRGNISMNDKQIAIVIPVYNESQVVKDVIEDLKTKRPNDVIIAVDDESSDNSLDILLSIKGIYTLSHDVNLGQGAALQTGIAMARKLDCKYVVTFDSDGQHSSDDIEPFFDEIESKNLDIVMGSRFLEGSTSNVLNVYQKDLVYDTNNAVKKVFDFLELDYEERTVEYLKTKRVNSSYGNDANNNFKTAKDPSILKKPQWENWSNREKNKFDKIAGDTMRMVGIL